MNNVNNTCHGQITTLTAYYIADQAITSMLFQFVLIFPCQLLKKKNECINTIFYRTICIGNETGLISRSACIAYEIIPQSLGEIFGVHLHHGGGRG